MRRTGHITWTIILLLGLAEGAGLLHTAVHAHAIAPVTGRVFHVHPQDGGGRDRCPGPPAPLLPDVECQVFAVFTLSAAPGAPPALSADPGPAPDLTPWRAPELAPVSRPFALWLLAPSLSPPARAA
jgi:hypothetical protein